MEETKEMQGAGEKVTMDDEEYDELVDGLRALRELENRKRFFEVENGRLRTQIEALTGELDGINISISAAREYVDSYEERRKKCDENIEKLKSKRDLLMRETNELHLEVKAAKEDEETSAKLIDTLKDELHDIKTQRAVVIKRLNDIKSGIERISGDKELRVPHLKGYESVLKQIYTAFKETQNRMEVSLMLRQK